MIKTIIFTVEVHDNRVIKKNLFSGEGVLIRPYGYFWYNNGTGGFDMTKLLSVRDAAPILNISVITIRRLIKKREIPHHRIGHKYFFTDDDIQNYISQTAVPIGEVKK